MRFESERSILPLSLLHVTRLFRSTTMSFTRALPTTLLQSTRTLARPVVLQSLPKSSSLPHFSALPSLSSSFNAIRPFSSSLVKLRYSPVADDPKWKKGEVVTYDELKPITQSPDNVSAQLALL